jgi:hypothetical protein
MIIRINNTDYDRIRNIDFAPETDIIGKTVPINRFVVELQTDDDIQPNTLAYFLGNNAEVYAYYWITDTVRTEKNWIKIVAQSTMVLLDRYTMPAKMYDGTDTFADVIDEIFYPIQNIFPGMTIVSVDSSFASTVINGYAPEQSARDRLLWVLFCARAYVKSYFNEYTEILPVDTTETLIPAGKTFWKPEINANDYVTEIKLRAYTYTLITTEPARTDKIVKVGNDVYIETSQDYSLRNSNVPITVAENVVTLQKNTLVNTGNVNSILADLASYYFNRYTVSADVLNDGEYSPGEKVIVSNTENLYSGFIKSAKFNFGHATKSRIEMQATNPIEAGTLIIECINNSIPLKSFEYLLPVGYVFSIENEYLDLYNDDVRTIYRPVNEYATGTVASGGTVLQEPYEVAIVAEDQIIAIHIVESVSESDEIVSIA